MGYIFRKSVRLFPGVRINFSSSGVSVSAGVPGMMMLNVGAKRSKLTMTAPGTGLSYVHSFSNATSDEGAAPALQPAQPPPERKSPLWGFIDTPPSGEIRSADVAILTSPDLAGLKQLINEATQQRRVLEPDWNDAIKARLKAWKKLRRQQKFPLSVFAGWSVPKAQSAFDAANAEATKVARRALHPRSK